MNCSSTQMSIISALQVKPGIDAKAEIQSRIGFIKNVLTRANRKVLVLGISGGIDSCTTGKLAQLAIDQLNKQYQTQDYQFIAMRLPHDFQADEIDAQQVIDFIQPSQLVTVNIASILASLDQACAAFLSGIMVSSSKVDFCRGNVKARSRMAAQFYIANLMDGLVLGTDHAAEAITGFYTKFGDGACDLVPLFGLNKRQVRAVASQLGAPANICHKIPTADLEDHNPQQPDELSLGMTYNQIDDYLQGKMIEKKVQCVLEHRYQSTKHKRRLPITPACDWY